MKLLVLFLTCALSAVALGLALFVFAVLTSIVYHAAFVVSAVAAVLTLVGLLARRAQHSVDLPQSGAAESSEHASSPDEMNVESTRR